jgi:hypothetical protein
MLFGINILVLIKYVAIVLIFVSIVLAPVYIACANNRSNYDLMRTRCGAWLFGWTIVGWFFALFVSAKK